jgi:hypothetical protein
MPSVAHVAAKEPDAYGHRPLTTYPPSTRSELSGGEKMPHARALDPPGHVHEDALGVAVPVRDQRGAVIAALAAIVPVGTPRQAVTGVLTAASLGTTRTLNEPAHSMRSP